MPKGFKTMLRRHLLQTHKRAYDSIFALGNMNRNKVLQKQQINFC
jgi:hypothetical protein